MQKSLLFTVLFLFSLISIGQVPIANSVFWKISDNGLSKPSYLYGTMHSIEQEHFFLPRDFSAYFNECRILATENAGLLNRYVSEENFDEITQKKYFLPKNHTIYDYLNQVQLDSLKAYMYDVGISTSKQKELFKLKPQFISSAILSKQLSKKRTGYESVFYRLAYNRNLARQNPMIISNLEEYKYTLAVLDSITIEWQAQDLMKDVATHHSLYYQLLDAYKNQEINILFGLSTEGDIYTDMIITRRNLNWIPKIEKFIHSQSTFIAVGAAHLAGPQGLIQLLRDRGYTVEPIYFK